MGLNFHHIAQPRFFWKWPFINYEPLQDALILQWMIKGALEVRKASKL